MARETLTGLVARQLEEGNHSDAMKSVTRSFKSGKNSEIDAKFTASSLYMIKKHENRGEQLNRDSIEQLVNNLIDEKLFDVGLSFIDLFKESAYLMELKGRILYGNGDYGGCSRVLAGVVDGTYGETTPTVETSWILGDILFQGKRYESAFNLFSAGLLQAQATKNEKMIELLTCRKSEADLILEEQKEKKKKEQEEKKKDEKIKRIKDGEENKKYDERKKKRNEERQKALEGKGDDIDGEEENKKQGLQFETFLLVLAEQSGCDSCFMGSTTTNTMAVNKSLIKAQDPQIDSFQKLVEICSAHQNLLSVEHAVKDQNGSVFLVAESVYSIDEYFRLKFEEYKPSNMEDWWHKICEHYWIIFRDVVRALMHLFVTKQACGNVFYNTFVTPEGRGRVLPSMSSLDKKEDLKELFSLMDTIITFGFSDAAAGSDFEFLPNGLNAFFDIIYNKAMLNGIPAEFLVDHPYFWSVWEKIDFAFKLRKMLKKSFLIKASIDKALSQLDLYKDWFKGLTDVYNEIYQYPFKHNGREYTSRVDIVRYFGAVHTHINDTCYNAARKYKELEDNEIEEGLITHFPNYYTNMFQCLCKCVLEGFIGHKEVMEVSSIYYRDIECPKAMVKETRSYTT